MFGEWRPSHKIINLLLGMAAEIGAAAAVLALCLALALLVAQR